MKIAIVAPSPIPFEPGGAEAVWTGLYRELSDHGPHDVELIKVPVRERNLAEVMTAYESFTRLDLNHFDLVISGKYPGWMVTHPHHVVYLLHPLRGLYDSYALFNLPLTETSAEPAVRRLLEACAALPTQQDLPALFEVWRSASAELGPDHPAFAFPGPLARTMVRSMDAFALRPQAVARHLAISATVAQRPGYFPPGVSGQVVHPPSDLQGLHGGAGEFFFTTSRHDAPKRLDLLIRSMAFYRGTSELVIGGAGPESARLKDLAASDRRIRFVGRLSPADLTDHYARAIGVPFIPFDEDLGLITIEAMTAGKPVLTTSDAGGPIEFVVPGRNGLVVEPNPRSIGAGLAGLEQLASSSGTAEAARRAVSAISWRRVATELVRPSAATTRRPPRRGRPRLVVTSTFPIWPPRGGGQLRAFHLYRALSRRFDIDLVCLSYPATPATVTELAPGMTEYVIPRSSQHHAAECEISAQVGFPVTDIVDGRLSVLTPEYSALLGPLMRGAHAALLADPFLYPAVRRIRSDLPIIYDAFNCEYVLKSQLLPDTTIGNELRAEVRRVEGDACTDAQLVMAVSTEDVASLIENYRTPAERFLVVPNGVDVTEVPFTPMPARQLNRDRWLAGLRSRGRGEGLTSLATFVGSWHLPNNVAGRAIVEMAPDLPNVGFLLMGGHCRTLEDLAIPPNVFLLGVVSNSVKQTVMRSVDVALAPLSSGSGTNLKVVEYLAAGIPLVSTAVGLRGLTLDPDLIPATDLGSFPAAIREQLIQTDRAAVTAKRARSLIEKNYSWDAVGDRAAERLHQLLRQTRTAG